MSLIKLLPSQQSADRFQCLPHFLQLLFPQIKFPEQCESLSQSPPPTSQGLPVVQQLHLILGLPLHDFATLNVKKEKLRKIFDEIALKNQIQSFVYIESNDTYHHNNLQSFPSDRRIFYNCYFHI